MRIFNSLLVAGHLFACSVDGAVFVTFTGGSFSGSGVGANYSVSDLEAGIDLSGFIANASGSPGDAYDATGWTTASTASIGSSMFFTITPAAGYQLTLNSISFDYRPQGSGPRKIGARVQVGAGPPSTFVVVGNDDDSPAALPADERKPWAGYSRTGSLTADEAMTVYLVGFDSQSAGKAMSIDNVVLQGTISAVPEPSALAQMLVCLIPMGFAVAVLRRRSRVVD